MKKRLIEFTPPKLDIEIRYDEHGMNGVYYTHTGEKIGDREALDKLLHRWAEGSVRSVLSKIPSVSCDCLGGHIMASGVCSKCNVRVRLSQ